MEAPLPRPFVESSPPWQLSPVSPPPEETEGPEEGPSSRAPPIAAASNSTYRPWPAAGVAQVENVYPKASLLQKKEPWLTAELEEMPQEQQQQQHQREQVVMVHAEDEGREGGGFGEKDGGGRKCSFLRSLCSECISLLTFYQHFFLAALTFCLPLSIFLGWTWADSRSRCLYVIAVMVMGWLTNCMDAYAVALFPFLLFPGLRVVTAAQVASSYMNSVTFLIVGASMMAAALRRVKLDIAAANWLLKVAPRHPEEIALSLMGACFGVSTCLSNTGTMLIFCPIVDLMVRGLHPDLRTHGTRHNNNNANQLSPAVVVGPSPSREQQGALLVEEKAKAPSLASSQEEITLLSRQGTRAAEDVYVSRDQTSGPPDLLLGRSAAAAADASSSDEIELKAETVHEEEALIPLSDEISHETPEQRKVRNLLFVGCAYAATLGGSATATGSTTNAIFLAVLDAMYATLPGGSAANPVTYTTWLLVSLPLGLVQLLLVWLSLCLVWMGPRAAGAALLRVVCKSIKASLSCCCFRRTGGRTGDRSKTSLSEASTSNRGRAPLPQVMEEKEAPEGKVGQAVETLLDAGGAMHSQHEGLHAARVYVVLSWFLLVCLWLSRRTIFVAIPGWGQQWAGYIDDAWPAMLVPMVLWFIPLYPRRPQGSTAIPLLLFSRWRHSRRGGRSAGGEERDRGDAAPRRPFEGILTFAVVEQEMDWGLLFLLGSGFVIASVSHACGLDVVMVENLDFMKQLSRGAQVACVMGMAALITQITSNTATASIFMPLLATVAKGLPGNPLLLMLAANFATTVGFLLPISTAANAVILRFTRIGVWHFFLSGILPLLLCLGTAYIATFTWVAAVFNLLR
ncbi:hypothetical protein Esti_005332 [Eimeria stiedai]